ncbi:unnamed protein product [Pieris macdunnoughi]|uniref:Fanconi anemia group D2 protein n=1 Tax=Pieris macdunnoughi TaxID=345717 RepID=A0A821QSR2_9NEOP|nr:unnamed protein product [Pieris macdunnoughi]
MSQKRQSQTRKVNLNPNLNKKRKSNNSQEPTYMRTVFEESGLILNLPPVKCVSTLETVHIIRNLKKNLQKHPDYPCNVSQFFTNLQKDCEDLLVFKHYLYPNIIQTTTENNDIIVNDSIIKILLSIPIIQTKLMDYIIEKAIDLATESKCGPWIQMILKCFSTLDNLLDTEKMSTNLINLLDIATEKMVRLEIITSIPDIIGDQEHDNIANEMSRILSEDHELIPAILDCLSYLCLSDEQYEKLQKKTLNILMSLSKCNYFPNFVKFLLMPGRMTDNKCIEIIHDLRNALGWPTSIAKPQDIASSQVLTATAIRNSMVSSKSISNAWLKVITNCKNSNDQKPIDFIIMLILYSSSEEKEKLVENLLNKQSKLNILKEEFFSEAFDKFQPILEVNLKCLINLTNCLLKTKSNLMIQTLAVHIYTLMFSQLKECRQTIVAELLQLGLDCKQCVMNMLIILNNVAIKDVSILRPQCVQMLTLLDRMDDMNLMEIRAAMNLLCCLAYASENSVIRDDIHMIIRKELGSSNPSVKVQGIISGIYAVKYLMAPKTVNNNMQLEDSSSTSDHLKKGDLQEASQIIELISRSTRQCPDMIVFFYEELCKVVQPCNPMNEHFLVWLTEAVTNDLQQNFMVDDFESKKIGNIQINMQHCLNSDSEIDEVIAINIGGLILQKKEDVNISLLSPLFQLVQTLHLRQHKGSLSSIDALLGCAIVMPCFDIEVIDDMESDNIYLILDCLVHCVNWIREIVNAFSSYNDTSLVPKLFKRISQVQQLETFVAKIIVNTNISYKFPINNFYIHTSDCLVNKVTKTQSNKHRSQKYTSNDETLPETSRTQGTQRSNSLRNKFDYVHKLKFRPLSLSISNLLKHDLCENDEISDSNPDLTIEILKYILKNICSTLEPVLVAKIKQPSYLSKGTENDLVYDKIKAEQYANYVNSFMPNLTIHLKLLTSYFEKHAVSGSQNESGFIYSAKILDIIVSIENIYNLLSIYLKWIGFHNNNNIALLKTSLRSLVASLGLTDHSATLRDLLVAVAKLLQVHTKYCLQLSTAVALLEVMKALQGFSSHSDILKIVRDTANKFLSKQWKSSDGVLEKGLLLNQSIDGFAKEYLINSEILELRHISSSLVNEIETLKSRNNTLISFKSINKSNFPVFYRNLGTALGEVTKRKINRGLTNSEHLELWKDVTFILKCMTDISKNFESRNNLSAFFKKSLPLIKLFLTHGMPIIELQFKSETQEVLEILKTLQQTTRFLQSLCCHSRLKKDSVLMSKVPYMRQLLETLIYKVKAALTANNCSEAFWMGNLKNKNIHGEVIASQQSVGEESSEDCDDQLPDDDDSDDTDDDIINPDSKSLSDII